MAEDLAGQPEAGTAPAETPAAPEADIESRVTAALEQFKQEADERMKGFQRLVGDKDTTIRQLRQELDDLQSAGLPDEDREKRRIAQLEAELEAERQARVVAQLTASKPDLAKVYSELTEAGPDVAKQLAVIESFIAAKAAPPAPAQAPEPPPVQVPPVDLNNPRPPAAPLFQTDDTPRLSNGTALTADNIGGLWKALTGRA